MIEIPLLHAIAALLLIGVRLSGVMLFAPFLGSSVIPAQVKAIFVLAVSLLLFPGLEPQIRPDVLANWPILLLVEFAVGVGMGLATNLVCEAVQLAGQVIGIQVGYSLAQILDPQTQVDSTVIPAFYQSIVMLLFLQMDAHYWLLRAIVNSYRYVPPEGVHLTAPLTMYSVSLVGKIFALGVQIAGPVLCATLATDLVLGLMGKASPQMPLMMMGPAIKSILGLAILMATLRYWPNLFRSLFLNAMASGERIFHLA
jgi:flagellar biosynthesis protein FliR